MIRQLESPAHFAAWADTAQGQRVLGVEAGLALRLLDHRPGLRVLDVGCGPGFFMSRFGRAGLLTTGVDATLSLIDLARRRLGPGAELHLGQADDLPFDDDSFDITLLNHVLETQADPAAVLGEAVRVTSGRVYVGVINRYCLASLWRLSRSWWHRSDTTRLRLFGPWEIQKLVREATGADQVRRGSTFILPQSFLALTGPLERWAWWQQSPLGAYLGVAAPVRPTFRTINLRVKSAHPAMAGLI